METVGIRELKQNLSKYIDKTRRGEKIIITDRKKEVAFLLPFVGEESENEKLMSLVKEGFIEWKGSKPKGSVAKPLNTSLSVSDAVIEDRR
ncbi:MAG: type II toxin-antitoxin system prevent-host-death family antitoxin [SAR324 cluster bacterium]|nr:type II toxin-antitoxin system prevent-host-death family antitoxin [SAR324 cluster bacterium]